MMKTFTSIGPLDGRYKKYSFEVSDYLSEYVFLTNRIFIEVRWLEFLVGMGVTPVKSLSKESVDFLESIRNVTEDQLQYISELERKTMHDVKAIEEFIKKRMQEDGTPEVKKLINWVHMFCTSEDINSPAYSLGIRDCMNNVMKPLMLKIINHLSDLAVENANKPMLSRTHGQPAVPTTFGKEVSTFVYRLSYQYKKYISQVEYFAKFGGAVGNLNAHVLFFPDMDWQELPKRFIEGLGLSYQPYTTQIESHDYISELSDTLARFNLILKDMCLDFWLYASFGFLRMKVVKGEVGSSTMPHKINPIYLENAEGNIGISNSLFRFFSSNLPRSRMQRDLSDSPIMRTLGAAFGHSVVAYKAVLTSLERLQFDHETARLDLNRHWSVLSEPLQVTLKMMGQKEAFDKVLEFTRGEQLSKDDMVRFIETNCGKKSRLMDLNLDEYTGLAEKLALDVVKYVPKE